MTTTLPAAERVAAMVTHHEVAQFLHAEARMIDERNYLGWLDLFTDDVRYRVPIRRNRVDGEFTEDDPGAAIAHFDDDKAVLTKRATRMGAPVAWSEDPPSIQRHLITNIEVTELGNGELEVRSCFQAHRYRLDREVEVFTGARRDHLRRDASPNSPGFRIAERTVYLDHTTVLGNNLNLFF